jgi:hypothetical protein
MNRRILPSAALAGVGLLGGALAGAVPAQAQVSGGSCTSWISGEWGHGKCNSEHNGGGRTMFLDVKCDAWWDADIYKEAYVRDGSTVELQGHCYSSVSSVSAGWK